MGGGFKGIPCHSQHVHVCTFHIRFQHRRNIAMHSSGLLFLFLKNAPWGCESNAAASAPASHIAILVLRSACGVVGCAASPTKTTLPNTNDGKGSRSNIALTNGAVVACTAAYLNLCCWEGVLGSEGNTMLPLHCTHSLHVALCISARNSFCLRDSTGRNLC